MKPTHTCLSATTDRPGNEGTGRGGRARGPAEGLTFWVCREGC